MYFTVACNGPQWLRSGNWNTSDTCQWESLTCTDDRVLTVELEGNNLSCQEGFQPTIPFFAEAADFSDNDMRALPNRFWENPLLSSLIMTNASVSATLPKEIGKAVNLETLVLSHNEISGMLPKQMSRLVKLSRLDLSHNLLTGFVVDDFVYLPEQSIMLEGNLFWWYLSN